MSLSLRKSLRKKKRVTTTNALTQDAIATKFKRVKIIKLTKKNELYLIQLCLKYFETFDIEKKNKWWNNIEVLFNKYLDRDITNHKRVIKNLVKDRQYQLEMLDSNEKNKKKSWIQAIDEWIRYWNDNQINKNNKKKTQSELKKKNAKVETTRANMMHKINKKQFEIEFFDDENDDENDDDDITITNEIVSFIFIRDRTFETSNQIEAKRSSSAISIKIEFKSFCFDNAKSKRARATATLIAMNRVAEIIEIFVTTRENDNDVIKNQLIVMKKQNRKLQRAQL